MSTMSIGQLAHQGGVGVETVRFYERRGLLEDPPRSPSGYREYPPEALERLRFIRRAKGLGFSLAEIEELLALAGVEEACQAGACDRSGVDACARVQARIGDKLAALDEQIASLERMRTSFEELARYCRSRREADACPFLESLADGEGPAAMEEA